MEQYDNENTVCRNKQDNVYFEEMSHTHTHTQIYVINTMVYIYNFY